MFEQTAAFIEVESVDLDFGDCFLVAGKVVHEIQEVDFFDGRVFDFESVDGVWVCFEMG